MQEAGDAEIHVLVVDDDPSMRQMIFDYLTDYDIRVTVVASGREMAEVLERESIDLVLLDLRMPGEDGLKIARELRERSEVAIIMMTGRKEETDRIMALELGADDYLTKPFSPREMLARIRALIRRSRMHASRVPTPSRTRGYRFAGWELNVGLRRLTAPDGRGVLLSNGEFNLLIAFLVAPQRILSREQLLESSRLHGGEVYDRAIDVQVGRLRRKLVSAGSQKALIRTERGAGYAFTVTVEALQSTLSPVPMAASKI